MILGLRFSILVGLITISSTAISSVTSTAALARDAYSRCDAARLAGADLPALKRAILSRAIPNHAERINSADQFFTANQVTVAVADLRANRHDFIAYARGPNLCGTSGCAAYVVEQLRAPAVQSPQYRVLTRILPARLPIRALPTFHNGARDIAVAVEGGGIRNGYTGALIFNGASYASNPTLVGVRHVRATAGQIVLGAPSSSIQQCQLR